MIIYAPYMRYLSIVAAAYDNMSSSLESSEPELTDWHHFHQTIAAQATIVVVFTVVILESYIHNYACRKLGETFTEKHIDKMSLLTKWLIVPQLATGVKMQRDHPGIHELQSLERARNRIVHLKGANVESHEHMQAVTKRAQEVRRGEMEAALNAFFCLGKLGELIHSVDVDEGFAGLLADLFSKSERYRVRDVPEDPPEGAQP